MLTVVNDRGRAFNVRVVTQGDHYGRDDKLTHDKTEPLVEFYDATYAKDAKFADFRGRGQFVARYYLSTLTERRDPSAGLDLDGGVAEWKITAGNLTDALAYAETFAYA